MNTLTLTAEINEVDFPVLETILKKFKAKAIKIEKKDPTKMSKEEFFSMVEKRRKSPNIKISRNELRKIMFD